MTSRNFTVERVTLVLMFVGVLSFVLAGFAVIFRDGPWWALLPAVVLILWTAWTLRRERMERAGRAAYAGVAFHGRSMSHIQEGHWKIRCENCRLVEYVELDPDVSPTHRNDLLLHWRCDCA